jgi:hypothetical protein
MQLRYKPLKLLNGSELLTHNSKILKVQNVMKKCNFPLTLRPFLRLKSETQITESLASTTLNYGPLGQLNDDDFVAAATQNIRGFHLGSETRAI